MNVPRTAGSTPSTSIADQSSPDPPLLGILTQFANDYSVSQLDGTNSYHARASGRPTGSNYNQPAVPQTQQRQAQNNRMIPQQTAPPKAARTPGNVVSDLLPYCTTCPPLAQEQVIGLTDAAGSLKELVLLVLGAISGDVECVGRLEGAVGAETAVNIAEFFGNEWEIEG